ncbi:hypothetical protein CEP53_010602 [Fusarium sp. AF-6]|nr:hypothetical protein CEP53_010602 [Fusarium sp. AF-6]
MVCLLRRTNIYLASIWCVETTKQEIGRDLRAITGAGRRHSAAMGAVTTVFSVFPDQLDLKDNGRIFAARNWMVLGFERPVNRRIGISSNEVLGLLRVLTSSLSDFSLIDQVEQPGNG